MDKRKLLQQKQDLLNFISGKTRQGVKERLAACNFDDLRMLCRMFNCHCTGLLDAVCGRFGIKEKPWHKLSQKERDEITAQLKFSFCGRK